MRKFVSHGLVGLALVATIGLSSGAVASAGGGGNGGGSNSHSNRQSLSTYKTDRGNIETAFRNAINYAHSTYQKALSQATTSAQRSAAEQNFVSAVIQAAATRSSALVTLGNPPSH